MAEKSSPEQNTPDHASEHTPTDENLARLLAFLREMFQLDRSDLDFGIYRIMNLKNEEVTNFLENDLLPQFETALAELSTSQTIHLEEELENQLATTRKQGLPDETAIASIPSVQSAQEALHKARSQSINPTEVYKHLYNFFARYYNEGDFMSLRRYKAEGREAYLLPYNGEEVKLHWANSDQYYIKTAENHQSYIFLLGNTAEKYPVRFQVVSAHAERDNIKADTNKYYLLASENPVSMENAMLHIRFEHRSLLPKEETAYKGSGTSKAKQSEINTKMEATIIKLTRAANAHYALRMSELAPTEKQPQRTILAKHLDRYMAKNNFDYFIHKNLGGFLRRELDLYIKTEVLFIDDIQADVHAQALRRSIVLIRAIRQVAHKIIDFLAQLENFQKQLWLKKKFVLQSNYCITLDRISHCKELYADVIANDSQREEWIALFAIQELPGFTTPLTPAFLDNNPSLVLDSKHFSTAFKHKLLEAMSDQAIQHGKNLDDCIDGLLIHSENFQALNLLQTRYREQIKCVYIDPPYNAKSSEILYKNNYKHSSYLSFLYDRLVNSRFLLNSKAFVNVAIDDYEHRGTLLLLDRVYSPENFIANIVIQHNPRGRNDDKFYGTSHEYMIVYAVNSSQANLGFFNLSYEDKKIYKYDDEISAFHEVSFMRTGNNSDRHTRPNLFYPIYVDPKTLKLSIVENPNFIEVLPINPKGEEKTWRWEKQTFQEKCESEISVKIVNGDIRLFKKRRLDGAGKKPKTIWYDSKYDASSNGIMLLRKLFGNEDKFSYPKSIFTVQDTLSISTNPEDIILDYFAGSGTTAHAVINLNREDGGKRKYILVEMGNYFDTVLKPRIAKVVYSKDWKNGKPLSREGSSHCFKYISLESYEDTLDSLYRGEPKDNLFAQGAYGHMREDYLLRYALGVETADSANLMGSDFTAPDKYSLSVVRNAEHCTMNADCAETFNYLLGLRLIGQWFINDVLAIAGYLPQGKKCLVLWRNMEQYPNSAFEQWFTANIPRFEPELEIIYINGDHTINALANGKAWQAFTTEPYFRELMFKGARD